MKILFKEAYSLDWQGLTEFQQENDYWLKFNFSESFLRPETSARVSRPFTKHGIVLSRVGLLNPMDKFVTQWGLFASQDIVVNPDKPIDLGVYLGERREVPVSEEKNYHYAWTSSVTSEGKQILIDAEKLGSPHRFINHSNTPNCIVVTEETGAKRFFITRTIRAGQQLVIDYSEPELTKDFIAIYPETLSLTSYDIYCSSEYRGYYQNKYLNSEEARCLGLVSGGHHLVTKAHLWAAGLIESSPFPVDPVVLNLPILQGRLNDTEPSPEFSDDTGIRPLLIATRNNDKAIKALLAAGANPNLRDHQGLTALFYSLTEERKAATQLLLATADQSVLPAELVNAKKDFLASLENEKEVVEEVMLLEDTPDTQMEDDIVLSKFVVAVEADEAKADEVEDDRDTSWHAPRKNPLMENGTYYYIKSLLSPGKWISLANSKTVFDAEECRAIMRRDTKGNSQLSRVNAVAGKILLEFSKATNVVIVRDIHAFQEFLSKQGFLTEDWFPEVVEYDSAIHKELLSSHFTARKSAFMADYLMDFIGTLLEAKDWIDLRGSQSSIDVEGKTTIVKSTTDNGSLNARDLNKLARKEFGYTQDIFAAGFCKGIHTVVILDLSLFNEFIKKCELPFSTPWQPVAEAYQPYHRTLLSDAFFAAPKNDYFPNFLVDFIKEILASDDLISLTGSGCMVDRSDRTPFMKIVTDKARTNARRINDVARKKLGFKEDILFAGKAGSEFVLVVHDVELLNDLITTSNIPFIGPWEPELSAYDDHQHKDLIPPSYRKTVSGVNTFFNSTDRKRSSSSKTQDAKRRREDDADVAPMELDNASARIS